jgi:hypothetical protein
MDDKEETRKTDSLTVIPTFIQCSHQPSSSSTIEIQFLYSVETKGKDVRELLDKIEWVMMKRISEKFQQFTAARTFSD